MNKKLITSILAIAIAGTAMVSCSNKSGNNNNNETTPEVTSQPETTETPAATYTSKEIYDAIAETLSENTNARLSEEYDDELLEFVYGISPDLTVDYYGKGPLISTHIDKLLIVQAKPESADDVEAALNKYREDFLDERNQYPSNAAKAKAAQVYRNGNYVSLIVLGEMNMDAEDEERYNTALEANNEAIKIIDSLLGK